MNKKPLGKTGIHVSEISFGGVEIGLPYGIGVKSKEDMLTEAEAIKLLHVAIDRGINFFDTARAYGESELIMGKAFMGKRDKVVISSKCNTFRNSDGSLPSSEKLKSIIKTSLEESLNALQTDYIDVYMLHQADLEILNNETIAETFQELKKDGIIRATGVSTYSTEETQKAIKTGIWNVIQLPFNLMDQTQERNFSLAAEYGVGIVVRSVLFKGILSEKGRNLHHKLKDVEIHLDKYKSLFGNSILDLPTLATKFALSFNQISSVLIGIDRMEYLEKAFDVADGNYLDENTLKRAKELRYPNPDFLDLVKWDKLGWLT